MTNLKMWTTATPVIMPGQPARTTFAVGSQGVQEIQSMGNGTIEVRRLGLATIVLQGPGYGLKATEEGGTRTTELREENSTPMAPTPTDAPVKRGPGRPPKERP